MRQELRPRTAIVAACFGYVLAMRLLPYALREGYGVEIEWAYWLPWNFSPIYPLALLGGAFYVRGVALALPLAVHLASDLAIAAIAGPEWGFYRGQEFTYLALAAVAACGFPLAGRTRPAAVSLAGVGGSLAFYLVTNVGTWMTGGGFSRPLTPAGLAACLVDGLPFLGLTLVSMAVCLPLLFSPLVLAPAEESLEPESLAF